MLSHSHHSLSHDDVAYMKYHLTSNYLFLGSNHLELLTVPIFKVPHFKTRFLTQIIDLHRSQEPEIPPSHPLHGSAAKEELSPGEGERQTLHYINIYVLSLDMEGHEHIWGCDRAFIILLLLLERTRASKRC